MRMKTPAITNQYGDMYTGMPKKRAMTIPGPASRRRGVSGVAGGFSGVMLATHPMLRAQAVARVGARPGGTPRPRRSPPNVGAVPYGGAVDESVVLAPAVDSAELPVAEVPRGPALSPSRAADFMTCPLLYRFRVIDRLPEPPTVATARGTLVHAALEKLFDLPAADRTREAARALVIPEWDRLAAAAARLGAPFSADGARGT